MHSAMSSKPTAACKCWQVPQALFLVCKTLYKDAQAVFYSENRFVVFDRYSDPPWKRDIEWDDSAGSDNREGYPYHRLGVSRFLRDTVPTDCLQYLRFLELVYPAWDAHVWPQEGQPVLQEWAETLAWALNHLNPSGLTIRMVAMDASDWEQPLSRIRMTREQGIQVMAGYMRLLQPLTRHTGLRRFYAQVVSPWRWNSSIETSPKATETLERMAKERAEKLVMGNNYSPSKDGCEEPKESVWHHCYERNA
ncbi:hypothetical protein N0V93_004640 [Gnomoniopsis smithogilvyi]|uniref:Uncharacterized protein n=1 Tax=Gnomoniopsis smithogilvyi TaxID=1191159 RepID=A0A9W8YRF2_9PEZI|nr:hypothetical protein N0V93_004640 [Gnomoniopsis smithogilvyi]